MAYYLTKDGKDNLGPFDAPTPRVGERVMIVEDPAKKEVSWWAVEHVVHTFVRDSRSVRVIVSITPSQEPT